MFKTRDGSVTLSSYGIFSSIKSKFLLIQPFSFPNLLKAICPVIVNGKYYVTFQEIEILSVRYEEDQSKMSPIDKLKGS
ncbi:MAG: hypothetical protein IPM92_17455 [Saprospiraceae bacterium]|nr:hypothetical protein [Saprospiraceae bacterium]